MKKIYTLMFVTLMAVAGNVNKVSAQTCNAPSNIITSDITGTTVNITADGPYGYYTYAIKASTSSTWDTLYSEEGDLALEFLTPLTEYSIKAQVECIDFTTGELTGKSSTWSSVFTFTTADESVVKTCDVPTGIKDSVIGDSSAYIIWDGTSSDGYDIEYKKDSDTKWTSMSVWDSEYYIRHLTTSTKYNIRISKICNWDNGEYSDWSPIYNFYTTPYDTTGFDYGGKDSTNTGINNNSKLELTVNAYDKQINIVNNTEKINQVVIINMMGQEVARYNVNKIGNVTINANFGEGNYIVQVIADKKVGSFKVFVR